MKRFILNPLVLTLVIALVAEGVFFALKGSPAITNGGHTFRGTMPNSNVEKRNDIEAYVATDGVLVLSAGPATYTGDCGTKT